VGVDEVIALGEGIAGEDGGVGKGWRDPDGEVGVNWRCFQRFSSEAGVPEEEACEDFDLRIEGRSIHGAGHLGEAKQDHSLCAVGGWARPWSHRRGRSERTDGGGSLRVLDQR